MASRQGRWWRSFVQLEYLPHSSILGPPPAGYMRDVRTRYTPVEGVLHDDVWAELPSGEYSTMEVRPGTVVLCLAPNQGQTEEPWMLLVERVWLVPTVDTPGGARQRSASSHSAAEWEAAQREAGRLPSRNFYLEGSFLYRYSDLRQRVRSLVTSGQDPRAKQLLLQAAGQLELVGGGPAPLLPQQLTPEIMHLVALSNYRVTPPASVCAAHPLKGPRKATAAAAGADGSSSHRNHRKPGTKRRAFECWGEEEEKEGGEEEQLEDELDEDEAQQWQQQQQQQMLGLETNTMINLESVIAVVQVHWLRQGEARPRQPHSPKQQGDLPGPLQRQLQQLQQQATAAAAALSRAAANGQRPQAGSPSKSAQAADGVLSAALAHVSAAQAATALPGFCCPLFLEVEPLGCNPVSLHWLNAGDWGDPTSVRLAAALIASSSHRAPAAAAAAAPITGPRPADGVGADDDSYEGRDEGREGDTGDCNIRPPRGQQQQQSSPAAHQPDSSRGKSQQQQQQQQQQEQEPRRGQSVGAHGPVTLERGVGSTPAGSKPTALTPTSGGGHRPSKQQRRLALGSSTPAG